MSATTPPSKPRCGRQRWPIEQVGPATYVTISLENGRSWLSSRLYLFIQALAELRGIDAAVCSPPIPAPATPWSALPSLRVRRSRPPRRPPPAPADANQTVQHPGRRRLALERAAALYMNYIAKLRAWQGPAPSPLDEWQQLAGGEWEHTHWLDHGLITELLGSALTTEYVIATADPAANVD